ncbi:hypothetical protein D3C72_2394320 [compost metagenome]
MILEQDSRHAGLTRLPDDLDMIDDARHQGGAAVDVKVHGPLHEAVNGGGAVLCSRIGH